MVKILILQEYIRAEHVHKDKDGQSRIDYTKSGMGQLLRKKLKDVGISFSTIDVDYVFPKIPEPDKIDFRTKKPISYKDVTLTQVKPYFERLDKLIVESNYDLVIPSGNLGTKYLLDRAAITKLRGVPEWVEKSYENKKHEFWVFPMYSMEYISFKKNEEVLYDGDARTLKEYVENGDTAFKPELSSYTFIDHIEGVRAYFDYLKTARPLSSWDLETNTLYSDREGSKALVISISHKEGQGVVIPLEHREFTWKKQEFDEIFSLIKEYVADPNQRKVLHNGQFDIKFLMAVYGITEFKNTIDTKVAYFLTVSQEESKSFQLTHLAHEFTNMGGYDKPLEDFKKECIKMYKAENNNKAPVNEIDGSKFNYEWFPLKEMLVPYAGGDVDCCRRIQVVLDKKINTSSQWQHLNNEFYPRLTLALASIEANGFSVNKDYIDTLNIEYKKESERLLKIIRQDPYVKQLEEENRELYEIGLQEWQKPKKDRDTAKAKLRDKYKNKLEFNPGSSQHKQRLIYDILGARPTPAKDFVTEKAKNKSESDITWEDFSTNEAAMDWVKDNVPKAKDVITLLLQCARVQKLHSTYVVGILKKMNPVTHRLHGNYNSTGTGTSRLSSAGPNMQTFPRSTQKVDDFDYKYPIKRMFIPRFEGGAIVQLDFSALEMRLLGMVAKDAEMTQTFFDGTDIHKNTAALVNSKSEDAVTKDERDAAKTTAFSLMYGKGATGLSKDLNITLEEAEDLIRRFFEHKPYIESFVNKTHQFLEENGYVSTLQGHKRILRDIWGDRVGKAKALRQSVNTVIQGTGAYLTNLSLILIYDYLELKNKKTKLVATVHDSIVLDCPKDEIDEVVYVAKYIMENLPIDFLYFDWGGTKTRYPIEADADVGINYKDLAGYDKELFNSFNSVAGYTKYHKDLSFITDNFDTGKITKEQKEEAQGIVKAQIDLYRNL